MAGVVTTTAVSWSACSPKKQTEYVTGVSTQMQVPRDLKSVRLDVSVGGVVQFCRGYKVYDGKVQLPRSLGQLPNSGKPGDPITVTVTGFTEDFSETTDKPVFNDCTSVPPKVGDQGARVLRRSRQPYVQDEVLFLPMPLRYSCVDFTGCDAEDKTCKAGRCVDATTDEKTLPRWSPELLDGTGGACFSASQCFAAGAPAVVVDPNDCTYALPNAPPSSPDQVAGAPPNPFPKSGDGINVEVTYDGGLNREILDKDPAEGFTIPDPSKPQRIRLAPGLCDMVKGYRADGTEVPHRITAVRVSGTCRAKSPFLPLCADDQAAAMGVDSSGLSSNATPPSGCTATELKPPKAALVVLADDTAGSGLFYEQGGGTTLGLQLSDPAFSKTEIGLTFFPGKGSCGTDGSYSPTEVPLLARLAQDKIAKDIEARKSSLNAAGASLDLDGALRDTYTQLAQPKYQDYYRRAVLVIGNRGFDANVCGKAPKDRAAEALAAANKTSTYVIALVKQRLADNTVPPAAPIPGLADVASSGGTLNSYDAREDKGQALSLFQTIVKDIATCVYDVIPPATRPEQGYVLSYTDPINPAAPTTTIPFAVDPSQCNSESAVSNNPAAVGFAVDTSGAHPNRVYLCGKTCTDYRTVLQTAGSYAALNSQPAIAVPVFSHKATCKPTLPSAGHADGG